MQEINLRNYAYLGDAVWELYIREKTILLTNNAQKLHQLTTSMVKTEFQYDLFQFLEEHLTPEEQEMSKRARNLPIPVGRKNIQHIYRYATAFETLIGWWYQNDKQRFDEMIELIETKIIF